LDLAADVQAAGALDLAAQRERGHVAIAGAELASVPCSSAQVGA